MSPESRALILENALRVIGDRFPLDRIVDGAGFDESEAWASLAELGWFGLGIDEDHAGVGCSVAEESELFFAAGLAMLPPFILPTVLAAHVAVQLELADLARAVTSGKQRAAMVLSAHRGVLIVGPQDPDLFLVLRPTVALFSKGAAIGLAALDPIDPLTPVHRSSELAPAMALGELRGRAGDMALARAALLLASQQAGIAEATMRQAVGYALERRQFGRPIGSFQAIKHRCADMKVRATAARSLVRQASVDGQLPALAVAAAAKLVADEAAQLNAADNVQIHGGIGFTWDQGIHLHVTRSLLLSRVTPSTDEVVELVAAAPTSLLS